MLDLRSVKTRPMSDIETAFARVRDIALARGLPGIQEGTSYGTPALRVVRKPLARMKDAETLVLMCAIEEKELLMEAAPEIYYQTDHYKGWPALLIRLAAISDEELGHRIETAWRMPGGEEVAEGVGATAGGIMKAGACRKWIECINVGAANRFTL